MRCWKCNKEFYSENLSRTLCDECLERIPKTTATTETTATTDFVNLLKTEMYELKISNLEAKLAESEKENKKFKDEVCKSNVGIANLKNQLKQAKEKLAEKEKENDFLKLQTAEFLEKGMLIVRQQDLWAIDEKHNQDKISFAVEQLEEKKEKLYFELLFTRLQWIHKKADECREEKERFGGIEDMALDSVWRVLDLQKHECCEYEEMVELEEGIKTIAEDKLLRDIEHDLGVKVTRTENEIFNDIEIIDNQIKQLKEGK